jgi:hypothetical protein
MPGKVYRGGIAPSATLSWALNLAGGETVLGMVRASASLLNATMSAGSGYVVDLADGSIAAAAPFSKFDPTKTTTLTASPAYAWLLFKAENQIGRNKESPDASDQFEVTKDPPPIVRSNAGPSRSALSPVCHRGANSGLKTGADAVLEFGLSAELCSRCRLTGLGAWRCPLRPHGVSRSPERSGRCRPRQRADAVVPWEERSRQGAFLRTPRMTGSESRGRECRT